MFHNFLYWAEYRRSFKKVLSAYNKIEGAKKTFDSKKQMLKYFKLHNIEDSNTLDLLIVIKSGEIETKVKTSYFNFSDIMKKITFLLLLIPLITISQENNYSRWFLERK